MKMIHCHALACLSLKSMENKENVKFSNKIYAWEYGKSKKNGMGEFPGSPVVRLLEPLGGGGVWSGKDRSHLFREARGGRRSIQNLNSIMFYSSGLRFHAFLVGSGFLSVYTWLAIYITNIFVHIKYFMF